MDAVAGALRSNLAAHKHVQDPCIVVRTHIVEPESLADLFYLGPEVRPAIVAVTALASDDQQLADLMTLAQLVQSACYDFPGDLAIHEVQVQRPLQVDCT